MCYKIFCCTFKKSTKHEFAKQVSSRTFQIIKEAVNERQHEGIIFPSDEKRIGQALFGGFHLSLGNCEENNGPSILVYD